jgi:sporulation protein YlmC with PRC-barrel domain
MKRMDIPLNAEVCCADGLCGRSACVILNPTTQEVTHLVVKETELLHIERLVPLALVKDSTPRMIRLKCTKDRLGRLEHFSERHFVPAVTDEDQVDFYEQHKGYLMWPYVTCTEPTTPAVLERVPPMELAVRRGAHVQATDGDIGRVGEFVIDPEDGHVTHLVLREGHLWAQKEVTIPVSQIERMTEDNVYLKLDKLGVEKLPTVPLKRWYRELFDK